MAPFRGERGGRVRIGEKGTVTLCGEMTGIARRIRAHPAAGGAKHAHARGKPTCYPRRRVRRTVRALACRDCLPKGSCHEQNDQVMLLGTLLAGFAFAGC